MILGLEEELNASHCVNICLRWCNNGRKIKRDKIFKQGPISDSLQGFFVFSTTAAGVAQSV